ncbi:MAG: (d)CMP kinase [Arachnia sp.]
MKHLVIAIDGPSGSGKSTAARSVADQLGLGYLDTGAMYRAVGWEALNSSVDLGDPDAIAAMALQAEVRVATDPHHPSVRVNGHDVTEAIREPGISSMVSKVAVVPAVREHLTRLMRQEIAAHNRRIVLEGRDITTVVAPDADVRVLLVADPAERVRRRQGELGDKVTQEAVTDQVVRRDRDDSAASNFTDAAEGVTVIDSTLLGPADVVARIVELIEALEG